MKRTAILFLWWFMVASGDGVKAVGPFKEQIDCDYARLSTLKGTATSTCWNDGK